jgi:DNA-binding transcriptional ArsR family regulator
MVYSQASLDATFGALADPTRREILARLATRDHTIGELAGGFAMSLPAVSKHVRVLERAGLATVRRVGRARHARLAAAPMREAMDWMARYRRFWEFQLDQLAAYLEPPSPSSPTAEPTSCSQDPSTPPAPSPRSKSAAPSAHRGSASSRRGRGRRT